MSNGLARRCIKQMQIICRHIERQGGAGFFADTIMGDGDHGAARFEFALPILLVFSVGAVFLTFGALVPIYKRAGLTDPKALSKSSKDAARLKRRLF